MKKIAKFFFFIPFVRRLLQRKYYATGFGTYFVNSFFKIVLGINRGDYLIHFTSRVNSGKNIVLNANNPSSLYLSLATSGGCYYQALNGIQFGEGTIWSYNCSFISSNHNFIDLKVHVKNEPIIIGRNVWIGSNCVILPGISLGDNVVVGAGAIVTKSFPENSVIGGNPAKLLFMRCEVCGEKKVDENNCLKCKNI